MSKSQKNIVAETKKPTSNLSIFILGFLLSSAPRVTESLKITDNSLIILLGAVGTIGAILMLFAIFNAIVGKFKK